MPSRMDAGSLRFPKLVRVATILVPMLCASGCFGIIPRRESPRTDVPEYRGASAQNQTAPPVITAPPPPKDETSTATEDNPLKRLVRKATEAEKTLNSYMVRIRRRETVNGLDQPLEYILCKYRRGPLSLHCKWLGDEGKGREIVYVVGQNDGKILVLTGQGDLFGAGRRMSFAPDSALVRAKFRYPITEASLGAAAIKFIKLADGVERGQTSAGTVKYLGSQSRPEFPRPMETVEHTVPPGQEPGLTKGGVRFYYFDDAIGLPALIVTFDHERRQVEYYCFDRLQSPVPLDDADFDPVKLWPKR